MKMIRVMAMLAGLFLCGFLAGCGSQSAQDSDATAVKADLRITSVHLAASEAIAGKTVSIPIIIESSAELSNVPIAFSVVDKQEYDAKNGEGTVPSHYQIVSTQIEKISTGAQSYLIPVRLPVKLRPFDSSSVDTIQSKEYYLIAAIDPSGSRSDITQNKKNQVASQSLSFLLKAEYMTTASIDKEAGYMVLQKEEYAKWKSGDIAHNIPFSTVAENFPTPSMYFNYITEDEFSFRRYLRAYLIGPDGKYVGLNLPDVQEHQFNFNGTYFRYVDQNGNDAVKYPGYRTFKTEDYQKGGNRNVRDAIERTVSFPFDYTLTGTHTKFITDYISPANKTAKFRIMYIVNGLANGGVYTGFPEDYSSFTGTGTDPDHPNVAVADLTVVYNEPVINSVSETQNFGNSLVGATYSNSHETTTSFLDPLNKKGLKLEAAGLGALDIKLFGIKLPALAMTNKMYNETKETGARTSRSDGKVESMGMVLASWRPNNDEIALHYSTTVSKGIQKSLSINFVIVVVPVTIAVVGEGSITGTIDILVEVPVANPPLPSYTVALTVKGMVDTLFKGGIGNSWFNVGAYGQLDIISASLVPRVKLSPITENNVPVRYGKVLYGIDAMARALDGETGFQGTFPRIKWCWGFIPCDIESYTMKYPIFEWKGVCIYGANGSGVCDPRTIIEKEILF